MPQWTHHRARVAALSRDRAPDDPELLAARRALTEAREAERGEIEADRLAHHIKKLVDVAAKQRDRLARILSTRAGGASK
jgi:hypothetical protein